MKKPKVIAEIGTCWDADFKLCLRLIDIAAAARCDYVKFQTRTPKEDVPKSTWMDMRSPPWGGPAITYIEYKEKMELSLEQYHEIDYHCKKQGIQWLSSAWGVTAMDFLSQFDIPAIKIPSAKMTHTELLRKAARWAVQKDREIFVSSGLSTQQEVDDCYSLLKEEMGDATSRLLVLFNCNSTYPAKTTELNLSLINSWRDRYDCRIGYSSHSPLIGTTVAAAMLEYSHIEVHITDDRNKGYGDHSSAVAPPGLFKLMSGLKDLEDAWGDSKKHLYDSELAARKKLRGD